MNDKMTYTQALDIILNNYELDENVREKLDALKASLVKRNGSRAKSGKETKAQREAIEFAHNVLNFVTDEKFQCKDIAEKMTQTGEFGDKVSPQKVAAAMKKLLANGQVTKIDEKSKSFYVLAQ